MKELKVILSPHFSEEEFAEPVSGIVFRKGRTIEVYSISLEDNKLSGIQSALRKNILLPYDGATRQFVNGTNFAKDEVKPEPVKEEVQEVAAEVIEEPVKKTRKRTTKKESE
ncbi:hypothetical protein ACFX4N_23755 [Priestia sp. YIM B13551]|uniref:hypothetical protein n=1 Tax=Priestia sp. YIM B13551 TaxID=3366306 RepID=UPI0036725BF4